MNKENAHLYLPLVQALADGELQTRETIYDQWEDSPLANFCKGPECYRRKPIDKLWLRNAECDAGIEGKFVATASQTGTTEEAIETSPLFIRWLGERIYYEVTE
jgi:hypothetical protein